MDYDNFIKNVKTTLIQAANEGKKKGKAAATKEAVELVEKRMNEFKESLIAELTSKLNEEQPEEDSNKEK